MSIIMRNTGRQSVDTAGFFVDIGGVMMLAGLNDEAEA